MKTFKYLVITGFLGLGSPSLADSLTLRSAFNRTINSIRTNLIDIQMLINQRLYVQANETLSLVEAQITLAANINNKLSNIAHNIRLHDARKQELTRIEQEKNTLNNLSDQYDTLWNQINVKKP